MDKKAEGYSSAFSEYVVWLIIIVVGILIMYFYPKLAPIASAAFGRISNIGFS